MTKRRAFTESLFDFSFNSFVAIRVIGILYIISIALVSLSCLGMFWGSVSQGGINILFGLIGTPLFWGLSVIVIRIGLESLVAAIKTSENTAQILEIMRK